MVPLQLWKKRSVRGDHDLPFVPLRLGDGVWDWKPRDSTEIPIVAWTRQTDGHTTRNELDWVSGGGGVVYPRPRQCCVCLLTLALGNKPLPCRGSWLKHNIDTDINKAEILGVVQVFVE